MTERLRRLVEADLDAEQLEIYRSITGGPRASGTQVFQLQDAAGSLNGPFGVMLHAPHVGSPLEKLGSAIRYRTSLSDREREIAILMVASATDSEFERYAHERVGRVAGLTEDELGVLRAGSYPQADQREARVGELCARLLADERITDDEFEAASAVLGNPTIIELVVLVGYYRTLAQLMDVFDVQAPAD